MSAREKSDLPEVAEKRANKSASAVAELVERRGGAKENAELQSTVRTQSREAVSQAQARIREAVTMDRQSHPYGKARRLIASSACHDGADGARPEGDRAGLRNAGRKDHLLAN
jgi:hypothetical protein